jgi:hypothetical protein
MSFHSIENPSTRAYLVKIDDADSFRPAAIDNDIFVAYKKAGMEQVEDRFPGADIIASAAHIDKETAEENAKKEAIERLSLSSWWALNRPVISRLDDGIVQSIRNYYLPDDEDFGINIGFVKPVCGTGFVAVSILEKQSEYPRAVLGGGFDEKPLEAAHKAFLESLQSWSATEWLWQNNPKEMPYWDTLELTKRAEAIQESKQFEMFKIEYPQFDTTVFSRYFSDAKITIQDQEGVYVAGISLGVDFYGKSYKIAEMDKQPGEKIQVFTQYNH